MTNQEKDADKIIRELEQLIDLVKKKGEIMIENLESIILEAIDDIYKKQ